MTEILNEGKQTVDVKKKMEERKSLYIFLIKGFLRTPGSQVVMMPYSSY